MTIGEKIRYHRKRLGLTQTELGEKLGVKTNAVSKWECGRVEDIPTSKIKAMSSLFEVPTSYLIDEESVFPAGHDSNNVNFSFLPPNVRVLEPMSKVPLIGDIACGTPILAEENITDYVDLPGHIRADFALTCRGDSMINAGIRDGDIVYIRRQEHVENGQIAAVRVGDDEATLKRFSFDGECIRLTPENLSYPTKSFFGQEMEQVHLIGLAVAYTHAIKE